MDREMIFGIMYALLSRNGREDVLFGHCMHRLRKAFRLSLATDAFPELWFEVPLAGDPWCDFHALTSIEETVPGMSFTADRTGGWPDVFEWFSHADGVRQLALSYDVSSGDIDHPAIQLLMGTTNTDVTCDFLEVAGSPQARTWYRSFVQRIPKDWFACYTGVFPRRTSSAIGKAGELQGEKSDWVRVECIPHPDLQREYASNAQLLESHLKQVGLQNITSGLLDRCQTLAQAPFMMEFQFNVVADGSVDDTFSVSDRFAITPEDNQYQTFTSQAAYNLMQKVESWGVADNRWRLLGETAFSKRIEREGLSCMAYCQPSFIKLRFQKGQLIDAKAYLIARVE